MYSYLVIILSLILTLYSPNAWARNYQPSTNALPDGTATATTTLTTYYPAPTGNYKQMRMTEWPAGTAPECDAAKPGDNGTIFFGLPPTNNTVNPPINYSTHMLYYCYNGVWLDFTGHSDGLWTLNSATNALFPTDFSHDNIGIGTAAPQTNLDVIGSLYVRDLNNSGLKLSELAGKNYIESSGAGMTGSADLLFTDMNNAHVWAAIQANSGNLGIGTATPIQKLEVTSGAGQRVQLLMSDTTTASLMMAAGHSQPSVIATDGVDLKFRVNSAYPSADSAGAIDAMTINHTTGAIGIGLTDPTFAGAIGSKFSVATTDGATGLSVGNATTPRFALNPSANGGWSILDYGSNTWTSDLVAYKGSVGIGGDPTLAGQTPTSKLTITATDNSTSAITVNNGAAPRFALNTTSNGGWTMYDHVNGWLASLSAAGGNIGIGTMTPSRKLEVNNALKFTNSSADSNDGVMGPALFGAPGLNIVGINTDGSGRKISEWGSITQYENAAGNSFSGNSTFGTLMWGNNSLLGGDPNGEIELGNPSGYGTPYIDFHGAGSGFAGPDYNVRIINDANGRLTFYANELCWLDSAKALHCNLLGASGPQGPPGPASTVPGPKGDPGGINNLTTTYYYKGTYTSQNNKGQEIPDSNRIRNPINPLRWTIPGNHNLCVVSAAIFGYGGSGSFACEIYPYVTNTSNYAMHANDDVSGWLCEAACF